MIRISVVIPTLDRPEPLTACLAALAAGFPDDAETIVVADGGRHDVNPVIAPFIEPLRLRLLTTPNRGPAAARNAGLALARGQIVAFTDDDCRPQPGWLNALRSGVSDAPPRAVGGATLNGLPANPYADAAQLVVNLLARHDHNLLCSMPLLPSNNVAFPAEPLRRLGGFNEGFRTAEDRELCRRWKAAGYRLGRMESAIVEHDSTLNLARFAWKFFMYGKGAARFHEAMKDEGIGRSARFHARVPALLAPELRQRGIRRGAAIVGLFAVWEAANLAGFVIERVRPATPSPSFQHRHS